MLEDFGVTEKNLAGRRQEGQVFRILGNALLYRPHHRGDLDRSGHYGQDRPNSGDLAVEYGFTDTDGRQPHWQRDYEAEKEKEKGENQD
jgi:hypothetical protein